MRSSLHQRTRQTMLRLPLVFLVLFSQISLTIATAPRSEAFPTSPRLEFKLIPGRPEVATFRLTSSVIPASTRGESLTLESRLSPHNDEVGVTDTTFAVLERDGSSWRPSEQELTDTKSGVRVGDADEFAGSHLYAFGEVNLEAYNNGPVVRVATLTMRLRLGEREIEKFSARLTVARGYSADGVYASVDNTAAIPGQPSIRLRKTAGDASDQVSATIHLKEISASRKSDKPTTFKYVASGQIDCDSIAIKVNGREVPYTRDHISCYRSELLVAVPDIVGGSERKIDLSLNIATTGETTRYSGILTIADRYLGLLTISSFQPSAVESSPPASVPQVPRPSIPTAQPESPPSSGESNGPGSGLIIALAVSVCVLGAAAVIVLRARRRL